MYCRLKLFLWNKEVEENVHLDCYQMSRHKKTVSVKSAEGLAAPSCNHTVLRQFLPYQLQEHKLIEKCTFPCMDSPVGKNLPSKLPGLARE